jgi:hypothetical protein
VLDVDFLRLKACPAAWASFMISSCKFFSILDHQTLDPDPGSGSAIRKTAGSRSVSGSALNQCGSETLLKVERGTQQPQARGVAHHLRTQEVGTYQVAS